ncbi:MAG: redoxin domain-containing protein [Bacteroidia bacterium]|nr:redoxin domain-containing protein [Bacteroidia bacterium]
MRLIIRVGLGLLIISVSIWLLGSIIKGAEHKKKIEQSILTLNHYAFQTLDGRYLYLDEFNPRQQTLIFYFHPECEHCQYEAKEFGKHAAELASANMLLITPDDSISRIEAFAFNNNLLAVDNLTIFLDQNNCFKTYFGSVIVPSILIYNVDKKLIRHFKGEIKMETIFKMLQAQ